METKWSFIKRYFFLVLFIYLLLLFLPYVSGWSDNLIYFICQSTGLSDAPIPSSGGCGDRPFHFVSAGFNLVFAFFLALLINGLFKSKINFDWSYRAMLVYIRLFLGSTMMSYGLIKITYTQFPFPNQYLETQFGDLNPMSLLWAFMGYSVSYNIFAGLMEFLGGLFLVLSRRTMILGAVTSFGVMLNVFMMNLCYDVCVKLFSFQLLALSFILIWQFKDRLLQFFIMNRPVSSLELKDIVPAKWLKAKNILKVLGIVAYLIYLGYNQYESITTWSWGKEKALVEGKYNVDTFQRYQDGVLLEASLDSMIWEKCDYNSNYLRAKTETGISFWAEYKLDTLNRVMEIKPVRDSVYTKMQYTITQDSLGNKNKLLLSGFYVEDSLSISLSKVNLEDFKLVRHKLRWVKN